MAHKGSLAGPKARIASLRRTGIVTPASEPAAKGPKPVSGRASDAMTTSGKAVAVRLSGEELEALDRLMNRVGASTRSDALRSLVRSSVGMLEFPPEQAAVLGEIKTELHKIGVNVNQIALAANRGRVDLARQEWGAIDDLRQSLPKVRTWLNAVVDEQRRRGVRLYRNFAESERG